MKNIGTIVSGPAARRIVRASVMALSLAVPASGALQAAQPPAPDNSKVNERDRQPSQVVREAEHAVRVDSPDARLHERPGHEPRLRRRHAHLLEARRRPRLQVVSLYMRHLAYFSLRNRRVIGAIGVLGYHRAP